MTLKLHEIDLSKAEKHNCPGLNETDDFLCLIDGRLFVGRFSQQWYGWNFDGWTSCSCGLQFDAPGWNCSYWEQVWRIEK